MAQWYGAGGCPPNMYQPAPGYDCRPIVSGAQIQQQGLATIAAHYVDDSGTTAGQSTDVAATGPMQQTPAPVFQAPVVASSGGGIDTTTLLIIAAVLFFVMKK